MAWTEGNEATVHVDGAAYFSRLLDLMLQLDDGDCVYLNDWEGQRDERLAAPGTEVGLVLGDLLRRGVDVRSLLWRSHPRQAHFAEQDNAALARKLNPAGAELLLDERVKRGGSHHQKLVVLQRSDDPDAATAFAGGIDLCHGRHDDPCHRGDDQPAVLDRRYGSRPPWHDVQLELRGPAVGDLVESFRERWEDPTPIDHRNPWRTALRWLTRQPRHPEPLPRAAHSPRPRGPHRVQVLRTYPSKRPAYPFAPDGERSIARAYLKAFQRARRLIYLEDQYFWSADAATAMAEALRAHPRLHVVVVVPRFPDRDGPMTGPAGRVARGDAIETLRRAGGSRVACYDLENHCGVPIYVHAKVCIVDDVWMTVGSDNFNRRSWTHDSELSCAVIDETHDRREPRDPAGLGDGARVLARDTRLRLWREHLGRRDGDDADLVDPEEGFAALRRAANELESWHRSGRRTVRPPGHARPHRADSVRPLTQRWARVVQSLVLDPDGRPKALRRAHRY
ncbi:MAG TPA: phospholipase D family protein [Acidimicrobiia bacterium]